MKLTIVSPTIMMHDEIVATVEAIQTPFTYKFLGKKANINLEFEVDAEDKQQACDVAKGALRKNPKLISSVYSVANYM